MLPVSLDCSFLIAPSIFSNVYLSYVLWTQCWQCHWIVHSWLPIRFSLIFICPVSCVLNVDSTSWLSILGRPLGFLYVYLACVLCNQCWQCLWIVHSWLFIRFSRTFICPVSWVLNVASVSALSILNCSLGFLYCLFVLCLVYSMLTVPLDCPIMIAHSVFSNVYLSCVLCTQCWQDLCIIHSSLSPRFSLLFICPMSCVLNVDSASGLSILDCPFGFL
jgi:hypothetical protein